MPKWIHDRVRHILDNNPDMPKSEAWAISTQQAHALGKSPKGYGTPTGRLTANEKYKTPEDDQKTASVEGPNPRLLQRYGNEELYKQKLAGRPPFLGPLTMAAANWQLFKNRQIELAEQRRQAQVLNEMFREQEHQHMTQALDSMSYSPLSYSSMVRLASIAADAGEDLAKQAGVGDFAAGVGKLLGGAAKATQAAGPLTRAGITMNSLKWKVPAAAAVAGAGYLGYKGMKGVGNYMNQEAGAANWGAGPRLAYGVNQYGQPQVGSQF